MNQGGAAQETPIHQGIITACAFLGSPERLATASLEGAIVIWDTTAGRPIGRIAGRRGPVMALAWDTRRGRLLSAGHDRRILACNADGGESALIGEHPAGLYALAISPGGSLLASGGYDGQIRLWRLADSAPLGELPGHDGGTLDLDFLDEARLVSVGRDSQVVVWDIEACAERLRTSGHRRWAMRVRASADGQTIYSAGEDGQVCGWAADTGARLWRRQFASPVWGLERSADGSALVVGAGGRLARLDLRDASPSEPQPIATETARAIARSDVGLMALGADTVMLYRADALEPALQRLPIEAPLYAAIAATWSAEREIATVLGRASGEVELDVGGRRRALQPPHQGIAFAACAVGPTLVATAGFDGMIHLRAAADGALVRSVDHGGLIFQVSASADGSRLLAVGNNSLSLWDTAAGALIWRGDGLGVGFHVWGTLGADGRVAVAVGEGPSLHTWRFGPGGQPERTELALDFGQSIGTCGLMAVVLIDAASAAVGTAAGEVRRVDLASGRSTLLHAEHESGVRTMALSPDRRRLVSMSENGVARLFDLAAGRLDTPQAIRDAVVPAACFTAEGDLVWVDGSGGLHHQSD